MRVDVNKVERMVLEKTTDLLELSDDQVRVLMDALHAHYANLNDPGSHDRGVAGSILDALAGKA